MAKRVVVGLPHLDALVDLVEPTIEDYCRAAAEYVKHATTLGKEYVDDLAAYDAELDAAHAMGDEEDADVPDDGPATVAKVRAGTTKKPPSKGKVAQIRLSAALGRTLRDDLRREIEKLNEGLPAKERITAFADVFAGERRVGGGLRDREDQAPYLLEGTAVVVFDHETGALHGTLPPAGSGLRWEEFVGRMVEQYVLRFVED